MIQTETIPKTVTFDEFVAWYPENSTRRYELHNGAIVEMPLGTGRHSRVIGLTRDEISAEIRRLKLPCFIPGDCLQGPVRNEAGYQPDVVVLDEVALANEPRWDRESIITPGFLGTVGCRGRQYQLAGRLPSQIRRLRRNGHPRILDRGLPRFGRSQVHRQSQTTHTLDLPVGRWGVPGQTV